MKKEDKREEERIRLERNRDSTRLRDLPVHCH
jgi:hypothetical protein